MKDVLLAYGSVFQSHVPPGPHPENPGRLVPLYEAIASDPVLCEVPRLAPLPLASESTLRSYHSAECVEALLKLRGASGWFDPDTYYEPASVTTALTAVGTTKEPRQTDLSGEGEAWFCAASSAGAPLPSPNADGLLSFQ
ncbi:MAG: hypothetical protein R3B54_16340 [Bdellovibrionota bacterium]